MVDRKVFTDSVTELPSSPGVTPNGFILNKATQEAHNERMDVLFSLAIPSSMTWRRGGGGRDRIRRRPQ